LVLCADKPALSGTTRYRLVRQKPSSVRGFLAGVVRKMIDNGAEPRAG
jgi:hypothetical protein